MNIYVCIYIYTSIVKKYLYLYIQYIKELFIYLVMIFTSVGYVGMNACSLGYGDE